MQKGITADAVIPLPHLALQLLDGSLGGSLLRRPNRRAVWVPLLFHLLGRNESARHQDFAPQNAWRPTGAARLRSQKRRSTSAIP